MTRPHALTLSVLAWSLAIAAGILESALALTAQIAADGWSPDLVPAIALRCLLYAGASALVLALALRRRWARIVLTIALSIVGTAFLALPLLADLLAGTPPAPGILVIRCVHILSVGVATWTMYLPQTTLRLDGEHILGRTVGTVRRVRSGQQPVSPRARN